MPTIQDLEFADLRIVRGDDGKVTSIIDGTGGDIGLVSSKVNPVTGMISLLAASGKFASLTPMPAITPRVMTSPPTVLVTNNTNGSGSVATPKTLPGVSYTSILCNDLASYLPLGTGSTAPTLGGGTLGAFTAVWPLSSAGSVQIVRPSFTFDGAVFSFTVRQFSGVQYRLMIDGEYATQYPVTVGGASNNYGEVKVTLPSRAVRQITIELCGTGDLFLGVTHQVNDSMQAIAPPKRRLLVVSDSYGGGAAASPIGSFVSYMAHALGFQDFVNASIGSTGWLANGSYTNIATRLTTDVVAHAPTDVVIALGHNDTGFSNSAIQAQVQSVLSQIRAALPNLQSLVVTGPLFASGSPGVYAAMQTSIQAGCVVSNAAFVDVVTSPIFTGTGYSGAVTGVGNADLYISSDGVHPTDAGSVWLGHQLAQRIRKVTN